MNERIEALMDQCEEEYSTQHYPCWDMEKFAQLIYKDIITVVAAQALSNHSALDVFKNLKRIYEDDKHFGVAE